MAQPELAAYICGPHVSVPGEYECYEAIWSQGGACKRCDYEECYRRGWTKRQATADNTRRVAEKQGRC